MENNIELYCPPRSIADLQPDSPKVPRSQKTIEKEAEEKTVETEETKVIAEMPPSPKWKCGKRNNNQKQLDGQ